MIKTIIFDFDGTIADTLNITIKAANELSDKFKYEKIIFSKNLKDVSLRSFLKDNLKINFFLLPYYYFLIKKTINLKSNKIKSFNKIPEVINELSKEYRIVILSSNSRRTIELTLKSNSINISNINIITAGLFNKHVYLRKIMKKFNLKLDEVIYVADEIRDIESCKKINIKIIAVSWDIIRKNYCRNIILIT